MNPIDRRLRTAAFLTVLLAGSITPTPAADSTSTAPPKAEGTWKWTFTMPDGTKASPRAKLRREGSVLTGKSLVGAGTEVPITDGKVDGDKISWVVVREHGGRKVTTRYAGRMSGETLKGTIESDWTGEKQSYPWEAKRASDSPAGTWKWEVNFGRAGGGRGGAGGAGGAGGTASGTAGTSAAQGAGPGGRGSGAGGGRGGFRSEMTLKFENGKLTGKVKGRTSDTDITNATFEDGKIAFEVERERGGVVTVAKYWGTLDGDTIKGKSEFEWFDELRTVDWEATRVEE